MIMENKLRGNIDHTLIFKNERESKYIWCKLEKLEYDEFSKPKTTFQLQCFDIRQFEMLERMTNGVQPGVKGIRMPWWKVAGFQSVQILHDPRLNT
jgi:hypothetical protein